MSEQCPLCGRETYVARLQRPEPIASVQEVQTYCLHQYHRDGVWPPCERLGVERVATLEAEVVRLRSLIDHDRTGLAAALDRCRQEARGRMWVTEGRGSYEWDDDRYRRETGYAMRAIIEIVDKALGDSGKLAEAERPASKVV